MTNQPGCSLNFDSWDLENYEEPDLRNPESSFFSDDSSPSSSIGFHSNQQNEFSPDSSQPEHFPLPPRPTSPVSSSSSPPLLFSFSAPLCAQMPLRWSEDCIEQRSSCPSSSFRNLPPPLSAPSFCLPSFPPLHPPPQAPQTEFAAPSNMTPASYFNSFPPLNSSFNSLYSTFSTPRPTVFCYPQHPLFPSPFPPFFPSSFVSPFPPNIACIHPTYSSSSLSSSSLSGKATPSLIQTKVQRQNQTNVKAVTMTPTCGSPSGSNSISGGRTRNHRTADELCDHDIRINGQKICACRECSKLLPLNSEEIYCAKGKNARSCKYREQNIMQGKIKPENVNQALVLARAEVIEKYRNDPDVVFEDLGVIREKRNEEAMAERERKKEEKVKKNKGGNGKLVKDLKEKK